VLNLRGISARVETALSAKPEEAYFRSMSGSIDAIDRKILRLLQRDATLTNAALAEQVGASAASCWRRVKALETAGVLGGAVRLVDPRAAGLDVHVLCELRLRDQAPETSAAFRRFIADQDEVMECFAVSGEWDYMLRIAVPDIEGYETFLMRTLLAHPTVATASSHFALSVVKYSTALPV
jgi:Lrp/AsnC family transcriptional regulator